MALDLADIQGNLLQGYRSANARHFALGIGNAQGGAAFVGDLVSGDEGKSPQITTAEQWPPGEKPSYRLNIGITCGGLGALGVPAGTLAAFPAAFRERAGELDPRRDAGPARARRAVAVHRRRAAPRRAEREAGCAVRRQRPERD